MELIFCDNLAFPDHDLLSADCLIYLLAVFCFVVRLFYSTSQMLRRDNREFYLLQAERIEGKKHILTLCSVEWPDAENKDCPRGKVGLKLM